MNVVTTGGHAPHEQRGSDDPEPNPRNRFEGRSQSRQGGAMIRRVVTGLTAGGTPAIVSDGAPPRSHVHTLPPGMVNTLLWHTSARANAMGEDRTRELASYVPAPGDSVALVVTFPPDSVFADPDFDVVAAATEQNKAIPGLAELFEQDSPGMHTTPSVDYGVVLDGEIILDLEQDSTVLRAGDIVVQNGTRHAWRNATDNPAVMFFVLIGTGSQ
ncbi:hypothetical protein Rwratislav_00210 [Rhodococcus wratislaviensis IFP 2016]|uniref:Cupin type-2 domain-containing protein n=2 Tax=Rhodococcus opacus TaxID=37919 RepID=K8XGG8_RHOOP|nr:hypothetical protein WSS_A22158 [Rhodococcus opacus M213]ELB95133.1 hypothetical protein Rwratislav_00210 [Rhodococcus wratislaviensis IFP 2016]